MQPTKPQNTTVRGTDPFARTAIAEGLLSPNEPPPLGAVQSGSVGGEEFVGKFLEDAPDGKTAEQPVSSTQKPRRTRQPKNLKAGAAVVSCVIIGGLICAAVLTQSCSGKKVTPPESFNTTNVENCNNVELQVVGGTARFSYDSKCARLRNQ
jgi:hypothetical protein